MEVINLCGIFMFGLSYLLGYLGGFSVVLYLLYVMPDEMRSSLWTEILKEVSYKTVVKFLSDHVLTFVIFFFALNATVVIFSFVFSIGGCMYTFYRATRRFSPV